ncbi:MAG: hypothetical protein ABI193_06535 [Minicystis sp.]
MDMPAPASPPKPSRLRRFTAALRASSWRTRLLAFLIFALVVFTLIAARVRIHPSALTAVYATLVLSLLTLSLLRSRLDRGVIAILAAGVGFYLYYLSYTGFGDRNYDGGAQLEYIQYILTHHKRPPVATCLICHHPPLYYALGALVLGFFNATKLCAGPTGLQMFSLLIFFFFLLYGVLTFQRFTRNKRLLRLATALIVFWPYSIANSVRLHNDTLACTLMAMAFYYALVWYQESKPRHLYLGALCTALSVLTKSSGYVMVLVLLILLAARFFTTHDRARLLRRGLFVGALLVAALGLNTLGKGEAPNSQNRLCQKILGTACDINAVQFVENQPYDYLYLDLRTFLEEPFMLADRDVSGRNYFWNHLLKSSLFGTSNRVPDKATSYELNRYIAGIMNAELLGMTAYLAVGFAFSARRALRKYAVVLLTLGMFVAFMIGFRLLIPAPHHTDFRHIYPAVILVSLLYCSTIAFFRKRGQALEYVGYALALPFLLLSIVFFIPKYQISNRLTARVMPHKLSEFTRVIAEGTPWDKEGNLVIQENETLDIEVPDRRTVSEIEVTLDNNDTYEVFIKGETETRRLLLGPAKKKSGLARYVEKVNPKVTQVKSIVLRPLNGDHAYSLGHLIVR